METDLEETLECDPDLYRPSQVEQRDKQIAAQWTEIESLDKSIRSVTSSNGDESHREKKERLEQMLDGYADSSGISKDKLIEELDLKNNIDKIDESIHLSLTKGSVIGNDEAEALRQARKPINREYSDMVITRNAAVDNKLKHMANEVLSLKPSAV